MTPPAVVLELDVEEADELARLIERDHRHAPISIARPLGRVLLKLRAAR